MVNDGSEMSITEMTKEICKKYLNIIRDELKVKDEQIEDVDNKLELIELGDQLPETAKPNLKDFIHKKVNEVNEMEIPDSVNKHLQAKHLMS